MAKETVRENFIMSKRLRSLIKAQLDRQTEDLTACARAVITQVQKPLDS